MKVKKLANKIKILRQSNQCMTQTALSELVGVSRQTISAIESGKNIPSLVCAMNIANALNAPIAEVFFWSDKSHKKVH
jgi:putative transcriptional regulator